MPFYREQADKTRTYGIRTYLAYTGEYGYFSISCGDFVFGDKCYAYVFKSATPKRY